MCIPRLHYEILCAIWGEALVRMFYRPARPGAF
jgi:hypothetical protein